MSPIPGLETVGLLGGGVIGGGWAARFLLNGVDVRLLDPDPESSARWVSIETTTRAGRRLTMAPLPPEGDPHLRRLGRGCGRRYRLRPGGERAGAHGPQAVGAGRGSQRGRDLTSW